MTEDPVERFFQEHKTIEIWSEQFDWICGTKFCTLYPSKYDEGVTINHVVYHAYLDIQRVLDDLLEYIKDSRYEPIHIRIIEKEEVNDYWNVHCCFEYKGKQFTYMTSVDDKDRNAIIERGSL